MKKKTFATLLTGILTATLLTGCTNYKVALTDTNPVHVEVGSELSTDVTDYITITDKDGNVAEVADVAEDITLDVSKVDTDVLGTYSLVITYKENQLVVPVVVEDTTAPEIEVETETTVEEGTELDLLKDVAATDNYDGDVTENLLVEGEVDVTTPGEYTVTYKAEDSEGNKASVERKVIVEAKEVAVEEEVEAEVKADNKADTKADTKTDTKKETTEKADTTTTATTAPATNNVTPTPAPTTTTPVAETPAAAPTTPTHPSGMTEEELARSRDEANKRQQELIDSGVDLKEFYNLTEQDEVVLEIY